jgi:ABC-type uncharacterized transport system involved in gliding motility auxiliary subunit
MALMAKKKKNPTANYAVIGLAIALIACIATGLLGAAKGMIALQMFPEQNTESLDLAFNISWPLILVGLAAYAFMTPDTVSRFLTGRQARYGSNSLIMTLAFLGILLAVNVLAYQNPDFLNSPWDMTEDKSNTLANETLQALATLPENVTATAFYTVNLDPTSAEDLLAKFKVNSKGKFDYTFVDPDQDPLTARAAGITGDGKILLTMGDKKEVASFASETELTGTLIRLISPGTRTVYFLEGHGEPGLESGGELSFSVAKGTLESKNYTVNTLNLQSTNEVPEDALSVIIAGPQKPLSSGEVSLLKKYVDAGGSLVVMEDPTILTEFGDSNDPLAAYLERDWGIVLNNDIIFDLSSQEPLNAISAGADPSHPITRNLSFDYQIIMPRARSVGMAETTPENVILTPLITTSSDSWGETELSDDPDAQYQADQGVDFFGPLSMAMAGENSATQGRVVVLGNSLFATDQVFDVYGNGNFFINSVDWAAEQEDLIDITPREAISRTMRPVANWQFIVMIILAILVLPGAIVFMGVSSWIARRRRG